MKTNHELAAYAAVRCMRSTDDEVVKQCLTDIIADTYANAFPRWIPCSERMPDVYKTVVFTDGKRRYVGWLTAYGDWHSFLSSACFEPDRIKMWHELPPLPQPPEVTA